MHPTATPALALVLNPLDVTGAAVAALDGEAAEEVVGMLTALVVGVGPTFEEVVAAEELVDDAADAIALHVVAERFGS